MLVSAFVKKDTWFAIGFGKTMDNGGGVLFRGEGISGNASSIYIKGHEYPVANGIVNWNPVSPS
jgi:hypothetical protein